LQLSLTPVSSIEVSFLIFLVRASELSPASSLVPLGVAQQRLLGSVLGRSSRFVLNFIASSLVKVAAIKFSFLFRIRQPTSYAASLVDLPR
jgi:hypothetical protein